MRSNFEARLKHLETRAKCRSSTQTEEEMGAVMDCMGQSELMRAAEALMSGDEARIEEGWSLLGRGIVRLEQGWTQADRERLREEDDAKQDAVWRLRRSLGQRHKCYPDVDRFDVLDVTESEIKQLVELAEKATCASDLEPVVEILGRLRFDRRIMDMVTFEALVLRGEIGPPPPPPDWRLRP